MAITPIPHSQTPYSIQLLVQGTSAAELFTQADFASNLHEGPLKALLGKTSASAFALFGVESAHGNQIRIYDVPLSVADASLTRFHVFTIKWVNGPPNAGLSCALVVGDTRIIEVRLNHTTQG
jgi:hypothetical protein